MSNPLDPFTIGLLMLFGAAGIGLQLGALVGWRSRFEWGVACGLLCIAAGGLGGALHVAWAIIHGTMPAVEDPRQPWAMVGVLCAFGGFGLLAGLFFVLQARAESSPPRPVSAAEPVLSPWRRRLGNSVMQAGNISLLAGMLIGGFDGGSVERSLAICFGTAAFACTEYLVAFSLLRRVSGQVALILLIVGGGCGLAAWAVYALR